ncbi:MAG: Spy/CpxP family protein refolding chaperone [Coraliomargaritaceae bacterium]
MASVITARIVVKEPDWRQHDTEHGHEWLHRQLELSDDEAAAVDALEPDYRSQRTALEQQFQQRIQTLRGLILNSRELSPEVRHAIHELHLVHGQLQELSIQHYYEMLETLPPEKQGRLQEIAVKALSVPE